MAVGGEEKATELKRYFFLDELEFEVDDDFEELFESDLLDLESDFDELDSDFFLSAAAAFLYESLR